MAEIGPLTVKAGEDYTAHYRESIMQPGAVSRTHLHSGPEAFYTEAGETCLETPEGKQVSRKGVNIVAAEGGADGIDGHRGRDAPRHCAGAAFLRQAAHDAGYGLACEGALQREPLDSSS